MVVLKNKNNKTIKVKLQQKVNVQTKTKSKSKIVHSKLPECTIVSQFPITDTNILEFKRLIKSPMDCVINALQLFGLLDVVTANLLRIPAELQKTGFSKEEIEMIFILFMGNNFSFKPTKNFQEFSTYIETYLHPGYAVFAGYTGHVFILARRLDGVIMLIDPQEPLYCNINECQNRIIEDGSDYFLLFNSAEKLNKTQLQHVGFTES